MSTTLETIERDGLALSMALAVAAAGQEAVARGMRFDDMLVSVIEEAPPPARVWRVHYGLRNYVNQRGGDFTVLVDERTNSVQRIIRGQ